MPVSGAERLKLDREDIKAHDSTGRAGAKGMKRGTPAPYFRKPGGTSVRAPGGRRADSAFLSADGSRPKPRPADKTALSALQLHRPDVGRTGFSCPPLVPRPTPRPADKTTLSALQLHRPDVGRTALSCPPMIPDRSRVRRTKQRCPPYRLSSRSRTAASIPASSSPHSASISLGLACST